MKKIVLLVTLFVSVTATTFAQTDISGVTSQAMKGTGIGDALTQLGKGIDASAFGSKWPGIKSDWFKNAAKVADASGASKSLSTLVKNLKPSSFTSDFLKVIDNGI